MALAVLPMAHASSSADRARPMEPWRNGPWCGEFCVFPFPRHSATKRQPPSPIPASRHGSRYSIAGESLRNAFRHAAATRIEVDLYYDERQLRLRVRDNGKGIDPLFLRAAGPAARHYDPDSKPVMELLRRVLRMRNIAELSVVKSDFRLELRGGAGSGALSV